MNLFESQETKRAEQIQAEILKNLQEPSRKEPKEPTAEKCAKAENLKFIGSQMINNQNHAIFAKSVRYANALNYFEIPNSTAMQENLFMIILEKFTREQKLNIFIEKREFDRIVNKNLTSKEFNYEIKKLKSRLFNTQTDFLLTKTNKQGETIEGNGTMHLFNEMIVWKKDKRTQIERNFNEPTKYEQTGLEITLNPTFANLFINLKSQYTSINLHNFLNLKSKHAKIIYKILSQFKHTGEVVMNFKEFCKILNISEMEAKDQKITIQRAIKEILLKESQNFKNLQWTTSRAIGRGGKLENIYFSFERQEQKRAIQKETKLKLSRKQDEIKTELVSKIYKLKKENIEKNAKIAELKNFYISEIIESPTMFKGIRAILTSTENAQKGVAIDTQSIATLKEQMLKFCEIVE